MFTNFLINEDIQFLLRKCYIHLTETENCGQPPFSNRDEPIHRIPIVGGHLKW